MLFVFDKLLPEKTVPELVDDEGPGPAALLQSDDEDVLETIPQVRLGTFNGAKTFSQQKDQKLEHTGNLEELAGRLDSVFW